MVVFFKFEDEFYNRYIVKSNLLSPVVDVFLRNNGRYNLLDSAILELFEFIKIEDIKSLCVYVVDTFGKALAKVEYVQTFKCLRLRYDQQQDRIGERERSTSALDRYILMIGNILIQILINCISCCLVFHLCYELLVSDVTHVSWRKKRKYGSIRKMVTLKIMEQTSWYLPTQQQQQRPSKCNLSPLQRLRHRPSPLPRLT